MTIPGSFAHSSARSSRLPRGLGRFLLAGALVALPGAAPLLAQGHEGHAGHEVHGDQDGAYASLLGREIKALSDEEVASLLAGEGMGFALAAELNGVPGPLHLLELREEMALEPETVAEVEAIFRRMRAETSALGVRRVELERTLDRRFQHRHLDAETLRELTGEIGVLTGQIRSLHLEAHLEVDALLTEEERLRYAVLRGYRADPSHGDVHSGREGAD
jgi:hypothetical protein